MFATVDSRGQRYPPLRPVGHGWDVFCPDDDVVEDSRARHLYLLNSLCQAGREELGVGGVNAVDASTIGTGQDDWCTLATAMTVTTLGHAATVLRLGRQCDQQWICRAPEEHRCVCAASAWQLREYQCVAYRALGERVHSPRMLSLIHI